MHDNSHLPQQQGARAHTRGDDIFIASALDQVNRQLIGHQLTHVVQQGCGRGRRRQLERLD